MPTLSIIVDKQPRIWSEEDAILSAHDVLCDTKPVVLLPTAPNILIVYELGRQLAYSVKECKALPGNRTKITLQC